MKAWPVQDAKARFSEFLDTCLAEGPQVVTRRGVETAVLIPAAEWRRLSASERDTVKSLLLTDDARGAFPAPGRGSRRRRPGTPRD